MTNDFIDDFIQEYKNQPCLWQAKSEHFKNRKKRQEAYMKLIDVAGRHGEHYNVERTKQKINNLRCAFRHQLKKHVESQNSGGKDEPYCPKRPYFESLMFLMDEEKPPQQQQLHHQQKAAAVTTTTTTVSSLDKLRGLTVTKIQKDAAPPQQPVSNVTTTTYKTVRQSSRNNVKAQKIIIEEVKTIAEATEQLPEDEESHELTASDGIEDEEFESLEELTEEEIARDEYHNLNDNSHGHDTETIEITEMAVTAVPLPPQAPPAPLQPPSMPINIAASNVNARTTHHLRIQPLVAVKKQPITPVKQYLPVMDKSPTPQQQQPPAKQRPPPSPTSSTSSQTGRDEDCAAVAQPSPAKKLKLNCSPTDLGSLISLACRQSQSPDDQYSIFGQMVAYKLRSMDEQQCLIAEKIITDVLLDGQMKLLSIPRPTIPAIPFRHATGMISGGQTYVISTESNTSQGGQHQHYTTTDSMNYTTANCTTNHEGRADHE